MEILKGFVFDIQRFDGAPEGGYKISAFKATDGYTETTADTLVWDGTEYSWIQASSVDQETVIGTGTGSTELEGITLDDGMTAVVADESWDIPITTGAATTFESDSDENEVELGTGAITTITVSDENLTFAITNNKAVSVEKGSAVIGLPQNFAEKVTANVAYTFANGDVKSGGASITFSKTEGITATTAEVAVSAAAGGTVFGYDLTGKATLTADKGVTLANNAAFASATAKNVVVADGAKVTINGWTVEATTTTNNPTATVTTAEDKTGGVTKIAREAGDVTVTAAKALSDNTPFTAGNTDYKLAEGSKTATFTFVGGDSAVTDGSFYLDKTSTASSIVGSDGKSAATATSGNVVVTVEGGAVAQITDLGASEAVSVTIDDKTFTLKANSSGLVTYTDEDGITKYFQLANSATTTTMTDAIWTKAAIDNNAIKNSANVTLLEAPDDGAIVVAEHTADKWFTAAGAAYTSDLGDATAAELEVSKSGDTYSYKLTVSKDLANGVVIKGVATTVVDNSSNTTYTITNKAGDANIQGAGFAVSDEGVISDAIGTITLLDGVTDELYLSGSVNVDITDVKGKNPAETGRVLTYVAGSGLTDTKVTLTSASPIIINEGTNDTDTVVYLTGNIVGLDAGVSVGRKKPTCVG